MSATSLAKALFSGEYAEVGGELVIAGGGEPFQNHGQRVQGGRGRVTEGRSHGPRAEGNEGHIQGAQETGDGRSLRCDLDFGEVPQQ